MSKKNLKKNVNHMLDSTAKKTALNLFSLDKSGLLCDYYEEDGIPYDELRRMIEKETDK